MKRRCWIWLTIICCFFAIISAYQCLTVPFAPDEQLPYVFETNSYESNGYLYYSVFHYISSAWDDYRYDYRNRLLSWGLGIAAIPLLFWVGSSVKDSLTGLLVAFLLAGNVAHLAASSYHRFYTANECCTILATGLCLWACRGRSWSRWGWYLLAMLAAIASMLLSLLMLPIHFVIVLLTSPQRSVALKRFVLAALLCCLFWGLLVYRDYEGYNRSYTLDFDKIWVVDVSNYLLSYGYNRTCVFSDSHSLDKFAAPVKRAGNGAVLILKWLAIWAGIGVWSWRHTVAWKKVARVKLALVIGVTCIFALFLAFSYNVKNLFFTDYFLWLIPYVVLILGMAMRTSRVFRIAMLTAILLASPFLSLSTTMLGGFNNVYASYAVSHRHPGELIVVDRVPIVRLPAVLSSVLHVPNFSYNAPGVLIAPADETERTRFFHSLFLADTTPWRRIWLLTREKREIQRYLGNGRPVRLGNHTLRCFWDYRDDKAEPARYNLCCIVIEPSDASEGDVADRFAERHIDDR